MPLLLIAGVAAAVVAARLSETVTLGSVIVGALVGVMTIVGAFFGIRYKALWKAASAAGDELRKELADEKRRHEQASQERKGALEQIAMLRKEVAELQALPNLAAIIEQMSKEAARGDEVATVRLNAGLAAIRKMTDEVIDRHEASASRRHDDLLQGQKGIAELLAALVARG